MNYFTRPWTLGELPEEEHEAVVAAYQAHLKRLLPGLPESVATLAHEHLHDGLIRSATWNSDERTLQLGLRCGDLQAGYFDLDLAYSGVDMSSRDAANLRSRQRDPRTEILYDEVDREESTGRFIHRLLFWPRDEIEIRFTELSLCKSHQAERSSARLPPET